MMNLLALCLVVTSLATAGVWSPSPNPEKQHKNQGQDVIVKEGHRMIVVEYDQDGHENTKISISPEHGHGHASSHKPDSMNNAEDNLASAASGAIGGAKLKIKQTASVLPNLGQGLSQSSRNGEAYVNPKELICDAYGKCKHKIADAMEKGKEKVSGTAHDALDKQKELAHELISKKKEVAHEAVDVAGDSILKAKETVSQKAHDIEENARKSVKEVMDIGKTIRGDIEMNVSKQVTEKAEAAKEAAKHTADKVVSGASKLKEEGKRELGGIIRQGHKAAKYVGSKETMKSLMGVVNLMGFATAYGMCVWVTFISSYLLSRAMPRQQFGMVQSKIYPVYFRAMAYSIGLAMLGHLLSHRTRLFSSKSEMLQVYNLLGSLLTVFFNALYLEPRATKVMFESMKMEKEEGRGREDITTEPRGREESQQTADPTASATTSTHETAEPSPSSGAEQNAARSPIIRLNDKLKMLNSYSSFLNILNLMSLTWHLVYLGQRLYLSS
ncbi:Late embryogenesis abundant protein (LEA) family protein [Quillaja saponaria]|uniref:Late embryogenesis abundant protein (LEA) family protein n=1 Tax=Quillaja saponaria TaxID=32244 RepID=A0AAD7PCB2_QUISA|nr:Late embryogenesis abundant protein (LEA) family protein [Quillaja saponaria]